MYARNDFKTTVGKAYEWASHFQAYERREAEVDMGMKDAEDKPLEPLEDPGKKVSLTDGLAIWQKNLKEYGFNQRFTIK